MALPFLQTVLHYDIPPPKFFPVSVANWFPSVCIQRFKLHPIIVPALVYDRRFEALNANDSATATL